MKISPLLLLFLLAGSALAETSRWSGTSTIAFNGSSTLHDWGGKVEPKPFTTIVTMDADGNPTKVEATVTVEVSRMDTAEAKRDENMRKAMQATAHPLITALIDTPFTAIRQGDAAPATLPLKLTMLGQTQTVIGKISRWHHQGDKASFDLDIDLSLKKSGITVPSVLLFIRVGDAIRVHASVSLKRHHS
ncbi:YceI family protein [Prosthecobacter vanneervenii]|uniref:Polyisoprenoid-binding protein YceI n=1 Tax=Prosthecobacter vanneervenii TaxID=48466 RepID=A0A7W7YAB0_9BACT|nr:YceI family protein [Prosthecobacter vanneervenii]MBB5032521.1 polyisoprenoid-binding protein YceI [Prosthecobacter vanneervenii]